MPRAVFLVAVIGRRLRRGLVACAAVAAAAAGGAGLSSALVAEVFDPEKAGFTVAYNNEVSPFRDAAAFVLPGAAMTLEVTEGPPGDYVLKTMTGLVNPYAPRKWRWQAPAEPGLYELRVEGVKARHAIELNVFVMVPASAVKNGVLNGYRIGQYPAKPLNGHAIYRPPAGFIEVTKKNEDTKVSPHFRLKQFVCKQGPPDQFPKYLALHERLPLKLEAVLQLVNSLGFDVETLYVMSGYRTPSYNHAIGDVLYSMHQWGSAADVFVDSRNKGVMDDLTKDGRVDIEDAKSLYDAIERMLARPGFERFQGGMGYYPTTSAHPPFVHVDVRGTKARWKG
jgi:hypothetical protein